MKKLIGSLILLSVFIACGSDGKDDSEENSTHDNPWGTFITEIDGMSYFFREYSIGNAGHIILVKDGKQVYDSTQINWNLGYIEPKIELIGTDSILIKKGVDGTGVSLRSLPTNGGIDGYVYHDIDVNGSPLPTEIMECSTFYFPGYLENRIDSKLSATVYRHPTVSQQQLASVVYKKIRSSSYDGEDISSHPSDIYTAIHDAACSYFKQQDEENNYISTNDYFFIPVWISEKAKAFTNLSYHCWRGEGMMIVVYLSYDTYLNGSDQPLGFSDIFQENSESQIAKMLGIEENQLFECNEGDFPMPVFYGITRNGVAVCFNSDGMGPDYKLLEYKKIKKLLRPNIINLIEL